MSSNNFDHRRRRRCHWKANVFFTCLFLLLSILFVWLVYKLCAIAIDREASSTSATPNGLGTSVGPRHGKTASSWDAIAQAAASTLQQQPPSTADAEDEFDTASVATAWNTSAEVGEDEGEDASDGAEPLLMTEKGPVPNPFYHRPSYQCKRLGNIDAGPAHVTIADMIMQIPIGFDLSDAMMKRFNVKLDAGGSRVLELKARASRTESQPWKMAWPRFLNERHEKWWFRYQVAKWRRSKKCDPDRDLPAAVFDENIFLYFNPGEPEVHGGIVQPEIDTRPFGAESKFLHFCEDEYTRGEILEIEDVTVSGEGPFNHECGPEGAVESLILNGLAATITGHQPIELSDLSPNRDADTLAWGDMKASWAFQHWVQNNMPKITRAALFADGLLGSQAAMNTTAAIGSGSSSAAGKSGGDVDEMRDRTLPALRGSGTAAPAFSPGFSAVEPLLWQPRVVEIQETLLDRYPIIQSLHDHIGWAVSSERTKPIHAKRFIYPCKVPPLQPAMWQAAQTNLLRVNPRPITERNKIVYCGRRNKGRIENPGRRVDNEEELMRVLQSVAQKRNWEVDEFDQSAFTSVDELINYFSTARVLIGPHGGCLTNVVFMGCNSIVLELFPLVNGLKPPVGHAGMMMYMQSTFLEMSYWMLPVSTPYNNGDFIAPLEDVRTILKTAIAETDR